MTTILVLENGTQIKTYVSILKLPLKTFSYMEVGRKEIVPRRPHTEILAFVSLKQVRRAVKGIDIYTHTQSGNV